MYTQPTQSINANISTGSTVANASASATSSSSKLTSQDFMTMLVAQLQNQDPTNPMDTSQMTSQLAQLSTVDGVNKLNANMSSLISATQSSMTYQATNLVGKNVVVSGNQISLVNGQATFGVQLPSEADNINVSIMNSANQVVDVLQLGAHSSGSFSASWNGQDRTGNNAPDGSYSFQVQATNAGQPIVATPTNSGTVNGISQSNGNVMLNLSNNTSVNASSLLQIN